MVKTILSQKGQVQSDSPSAIFFFSQRKKNPDLTIVKHLQTCVSCILLYFLLAGGDKDNAVLVTLFLISLSLNCNIAIESEPSLAFTSFPSLLTKEISHRLKLTFSHT